MNKYIYVIISFVFCTQKNIEMINDKAKMEFVVTEDSSNECNIIEIRYGELIFKDTLVNNFKLVRYVDSEVVFVSGHSSTYRMTAIYAIVNNIIEKKVFVLDRVSLNNELSITQEIFPYVVENNLKIIDENGRLLLDQEFLWVSDDIRFECVGYELSVFHSDSLLSIIDLSSMLN